MQAKEIGVSYTLNGTGITLPADLFNSTEPLVVVNVIYVTLNNIFQLADYKLSSEQRSTAKNKVELKADTTMVSSTIRPPPTDKLKSLVKIFLYNINVSLLFKNALADF